ncbi:hypothetical protein BH23BAC1_BH23BAC1_05770 [soil metagenome]
MKETHNLHRREFPLWSFAFKAASTVDAFSRKDIEFNLISKALKDKDFKQSLLEDGKAAVEDMFNLKLPDALSLQVMEETDDNIYLVLPHNPYAGIPEPEIQYSLGMDFEDIASWLLDQQKELLPEDKKNHLKLIVKSWRDESFKKLLIADPKLVIEQEFGEKIEDHISIQVLEEAEDKVFIVIPHLPDSVLIKTEIDKQIFNLPIVIGSGLGGGETGPYRKPVPGEPVPV